MTQGTPRILGLLGWSGSGKTHLLTRLLPEFTARGLVVSTIKHAHHGFDLDQPGKDSYQHRQAGAREVLIASSKRWALMHELDGPEPTLDELLPRLSPCDLVLVEGFKASVHPKIEILRQGQDRPAFWPERQDVVAVASDAAVPGCPLPVLPLDDAACVAIWCMDFLRDNAQ